MKLRIFYDTEYFPNYHQESMKDDCKEGEYYLEIIKKAIREIESLRYDLERANAKISKAYLIINDLPETTAIKVWKRMGAIA